MYIGILPSLLAADPGNLEAGARKAQQCGGDELHLDIMDGHFVPNISMGPAVVEMAHGCVTIPLSVHLMLTRPDRYVDVFSRAGAASLLIHIEAACDVSATLERIRDLGVHPGITLNPETPAETIFEVMPGVDEVLCMTVQPGYGGQAFMSEIIPKIRQVRDHADALGRKDLKIMVDGGINHDTAAQCAAAGANAFVAGTFFYRARDMAAEIATMRKRVAEVLTR